MTEYSRNLLDVPLRRKANPFGWQAVRSHSFLLTYKNGRSLITCISSAMVLLKFSSTDEHDTL